MGVGAVGASPEVLLVDADQRTADLHQLRCVRVARFWSHDVPSGRHSLAAGTPAWGDPRESGRRRDWIVDTGQRTCPARGARADDTACRERRDQRRTSPVELLWDLVFVFAVTEVSELLGHDLSWAAPACADRARADLVGLVGVRLGRQRDEMESPTLQVGAAVGLVLIFIAGLAVPHVFRERAMLFACHLRGRALLHLGLYADASLRGNASWSAIVGFAATATPAWRC